MLLLQGITKPGTRLWKEGLSPQLSVFPSVLPEVTVVGCVVSINHGVAFTKFVVIAGFPGDLIGRLSLLSDPTKWQKKDP